MAKTETAKKYNTSIISRDMKVNTKKKKKKSQLRE